MFLGRTDVEGDALAAFAGEIAGVEDAAGVAPDADPRREALPLTDEDIAAGVEPWVDLLDDVMADLGPNPSLAKTEEWMRERTEPAANKDIAPEKAR